jgi:hypothetical protein
VHHALQLGAPISLECVSIDGKSETTFPNRATIRLDFPERGGMPPVKVFYHDSAQPTDPDVYRVPGLDNETILPPPDNLADKGRITRQQRGSGQGFGGGRGPGAPGQAKPPRRTGERVGAGGPGVKVFGPERTGPVAGILTGNGSVFIGTKGVMATSNRGEGVWLLPSARWQEYVLPPQLLTRSPGHMLDWIRACKGGDPSCSDFRIAVPFAEWLALAAIAFRVAGRLEWDSRNVRFTNSAEANRYVKPVFRKGWELKV